MSDAAMTWAALLAKWTEFARAGVALPKTAEGDRWRSALPHIIALQAVTHALPEADGLDMVERAVAIDRAAVIIRDHSTALHRLWRSDPLPTPLVELMDDAMRALDALRKARSGGEHLRSG